MNDLDLQVGDKLQYKCNGEIHTLVIGDKHDLNLYNEHNEFLGLEVLKIERPIYTTIYEKKEILDSVEKEYLKSVIRPFKKIVTAISKKQSGNLYFISISLAPSEVFLSEEFINLPFFKNKEMYAGMKSDKKYTLKELGL